MRNVFSDSELNASFLEKGYVILDLLDQGACDEGIAIYEKIHGNGAPKSFFTTTHSFDQKYRQACNEAIKGFLTPHVSVLLDNYIPLYGNFMIKPPGVNSECGLHQDWTFVDEENFRTVNVWVALQDTDIHNGCIHVIPGSQNLPFPIRGRNIERVYNEAMGLMKDNLMKALPLKKGQCVVFDSAVLHYSPDNASEKMRIAVSLMLYPADAALIHYSKNKSSGEIKKYMVNPDFFVDFASAEDYSSQSGEVINLNRGKVTFESIKSGLTTIV
jgi:hypothetical protein